MQIQVLIVNNAVGMVLGNHVKSGSNVLPFTSMELHLFQCTFNGEIVRNDEFTYKTELGSYIITPFTRWLNDQMILLYFNSTPNVTKLQ